MTSQFSNAQMQCQNCDGERFGPVVEPVECTRCKKVMCSLDCNNEERDKMDWVRIRGCFPCDATFCDDCNTCLECCICQGWFCRECGQTSVDKRMTKCAFTFAVDDRCTMNLCGSCSRISQGVCIFHCENRTGSSWYIQNEFGMKAQCS